MSEDLLRRMFDAIHFYEIAKQEAKRAILCEPHREHAIRAAIDQAGAADVLTVRAHQICPEGKLLVLDEGALEAQHNEWLQGMTKKRII